MKELRVGGKDPGGSEYGLPAISTLSSSWKMLLGWEAPVEGSTYQSGEPLTGLGSKISQLAAQCLRQLIHSDIVLQEGEEEKKYNDSVFQKNLPSSGSLLWRTVIRAREEDT